MKICLIEEVKEWEKISHEWNDLIAINTDHFNPFLSFEWLFSWWEVFGNGRRLCITIARNEGKLVGIAPLMISSKMGTKICELIGTGRSDYLGFIVEKENRKEIFMKLFDFISNNLKWHLIYLRDYIDSPHELQYIAEKIGLKINSIVGDFAPRLIIKDSWDEYLASKSVKNRGNIKRAIRKIESDDDVFIKCERNYLPHIVEELAEVEARSWKVDTGEPRYSGRGSDFFKAFFKRLSVNNWLELWTLRYKKHLLSYSVNFVGGEITYNYNIAYDKDYKKYIKHHSIGSVLTSIALRDSFQKKRKVYDFLRGDEPYKKLWANEAKDLSYIAIYKKQFISFVAYLLFFKLRLYIRENKVLKKVFLPLKKWGILK